MAHIWAQTITINKDLAKQLIENQTDLVVKSIEPLGEGFDNIAYLVNKEFVFRFPRREMGVECMENEITLLPYIAGHVSFPASFPKYIGQTTDQYAAPFAGYRLLPGMPLSDTEADLSIDTNFAKELAQWLKDLHFIPIRKEHYSQIKGDQSWRIDIANRSKSILKSIEQYEHYFNEAGFQKDLLLKTLQKFQLYDLSSAHKNTYCHGDLYSRHIIVDEHRNLTGLIDWGDIHIGNPGTDLSVAFMIFSGEALQSFFDTYGAIDEVTYQIARFRAFWHPIILLPYCYEMQEENLKKWAAFALKQAIGGL